MDRFVQDSEKLVRFDGLNRGISKGCQKDVERDSRPRIRLCARSGKDCPIAKASSEFGSLFCLFVNQRCLI